MDRRAFLRGAAACTAGALCSLGTAACCVDGLRDTDEATMGGAMTKRAFPSRIACAGDSITYGEGVRKTRAMDSYPAKLAAFLASDGHTVQVDNFGHSGACALSDGKHPYIDMQEYYASLASDADLVILMLGTNDAASIAWDGLAYRRDLGDFVDAYQGEDEGAGTDSRLTRQVMLMVPPDITRKTFGAAYTDEKFAEMQQLVRELTIQRGLMCVDLELVFAGHEGEWLVDGVHPNADGNEQIARAIVEALA